MIPVKFRAFRKAPPPPRLPEPLVTQLDQGISNPQTDPWPDTISETLSKAIEGSGLTWEQLCERMRKPGTKTTITRQFIQEALTQDPPEMWLQMRILTALEIPWEDYERTMEANDREQDRITHQHSTVRTACKHYREYGPRLFAMVKTGTGTHVHSTGEFLLLNRLVAMPKNKSFNPPSAEAMGNTIREHPGTCSHEKARQRHAIGGYRYHRLPDEFHDFDLMGNLLASGDAMLPPPPGLAIMQVRACCGGVIRRPAKPPTHAAGKK